MRIVPIASIAVSANRQRQEFDPEALSDLCDDIAERGLLHPVVVRADGEGYILVAGERRLRAISDLAEAGITIRHDDQEIPLDSVPVATLGDLSPIEAEEAELSENINRADLTWQERAQAEARLHTLRTAQAEARGEKQTYLATAEELAGRPLKGTTEQSYAQTIVKQSVVVAKHLDDPEVAAAKTPREAFKIVQRKAEEKHYQSIAAQLSTVQTHERHTLVKGDAREKLLEVPSDTFDCLLTDPPYGIDAQDFGTQVSNSHKFDDTYETWQKTMPLLATEGYRACHAQAHAYVFCDPRRFEELKGFFQAAGWDCWSTPLIWIKPGSGMLPRPEHGPRRSYETILYALKGDKKVTGVFSDVLIYPPEKTTIHPDQKPVLVYADLLRRSTRPGNFVLDPFAGSGTIFVAANKLQLTATGIEGEDTSYAISVERMKETLQ